MLCLCAGSRPEFLKLIPIINKLKENNVKFKTVYVKQHTTLMPYFEYDEVVEIDKTCGNRLNEIVASVLLNSNKALEGVDHVMVQGDTSSAFAMALAAFHRGIKVIHVEAGLRTYDQESPYPEEVNRQLISKIASLHFAPTFQNESNLFFEKVAGRVVRSGNTVFDGVDYPANSANPTDVLITMHRREKDSEDIEKWIRAYSVCQRALPYLNFKFIKHPRMDNKLFEGVDFQVIEPVPHDVLLQMIADSMFVITDSGGLQEECSFMGKTCFVTRDNTERPESIGTTSFLCSTPEQLWPMVSWFINSPASDKIAKCPFTFGKGVATEIIFNTLKEENII